MVLMGALLFVSVGMPLCRIELKNSHWIPFWSIPVTPFLCAFRSPFHWNAFANFGLHQMIPTGILWNDRIPPDSGRNQWRTVKTSTRDFKSST